MQNDKSYLDETDTDILSDIISRKEFLIFKRSAETIRFADKLQESDDAKNIIPKFLISEHVPQSNYLELRSYQMLTRNYLNPNTPYSRLLLKWETGHGKTIAAISIAMNFIEYYKKQDETMSKIGSVYIIGFTQTIFKDELLKYPEFGFISRDELEQYNAMKKISHSGDASNIEKLRKFTTNLKKRLYNRKNNGFFKFIGYKELANHLFIYDKKIDLTTVNEQEINELLKSNALKINTKLLNEFDNSLIICDEIHNVYNTREKNNWGIAIQIILNTYKSCRALFLSATPLNNSPTEIIDLLNLLLPREYYPSLNKNDFFTIINKIQVIKKTKEVELINYLKGRVSFIRDRNPKFIATKKMLGHIIPGIDYLSFVQCEMSKFHYNTYKQVELELQNKDTLGQDGQYLIDYVIPDPEVKNAYKSKALGLYKPRDIKSKLNNAPVAWREKNGIAYNETDEIVVGHALQRNTLSIISAKYSTMINTILTNIANLRGKMFIYHNYIHMTGTLFIQEILLQNNIISEFGNSSINTLCICGRKKKDHRENEMVYHETLHYFQPVRFTIVHSNLEKSQIIRSLEKFNNASNITGSNVMILIGSKIMKEAHSINSVRNIIIMSRPDNISSLIQIIGRAIRLNSHKLLPTKQQHVDISILVSSVPGLKTLSYEEKKYKQKIDTFKVIQQIEKFMHINAIDAYFNYDTIWETNNREKFLLDILPYNIKFKPQELNLSTFNVYHAKFEVQYFMTIIKRLFIETSSVWLYKDLYNAVKFPPFTIEINPLISQDIFNIALNNIVYSKSITYAEPIITNLSEDLLSINLIDKIQNADDKIILVLNGVNYVITHIGELYTLVPLHNEDIFVDTESIYRTLQLENIQYVDVLNFLQYETDNFSNKKIKFINKWHSTNIIDLEPALCDFGTAFHMALAEDIIMYIFNILTQHTPVDVHHDFYLKMLYFYDLYQLIVWASTIDTTLQPKYNIYVTPAIILNMHLQNNETNQLITELHRSNITWLSTQSVKEYNENIIAIQKQLKSNKKVPANLLPVGHYFDSVPRFYLPSGWYDYTITQRPIKENDIIIGFDQRSKTGIVVKFKLRLPVQQIKKSADSRLIQKGVNCNSKSKEELQQIAKKLNINIANVSTVDELCIKIRQRLIYLELKEKDKPVPIKYFYNVITSEK